ncbi:MAG: MotA/TolQ/ExbB proton channel family protein [Planctomycetota bacterium]
MTLLLAQEAAATPDQSLLDYVAQGREIGLIIILISLVAVGLIIAQLVLLRLRRLAPEQHADALRQLLGRRDVPGAIAFSGRQENDSMISRTIGAALRRCARSPFGLLELGGAVEEAGQREMSRAGRLTDALGVLAAIAPMLGLLGTVVGMVGAFQTVSVSQGPVEPDALAGNISQALITTVLGLLVAIPCTAAHAFLRSRAESIGHDLAEVLEELIAPLQSGQQTRPQPAPAGQQGAARPVPAPQGAQPAPKPAAAAPAQPGQAGSIVGPRVPHPGTNA